MRFPPTFHSLPSWISWQQYQSMNINFFSRGLNLLACCGKETTLYSHSYEKLVAPKIPLGRKEFFSYVCRIVHACKKLNSVLLNIILLFLLNNVLNAPTFIIAFMPQFFLFPINRVLNSFFLSLFIKYSPSS